MFSDVPSHPDTLTRDLIVQIGSQIGIMYESDSIHDVSRAPSRETPGSNQVGTAVRPPDLFVKFKFASICNEILAEMRKRKGITFHYRGVAQDVTIKAYEVLTGERNAQLAAIRQVAVERRIIVWHFDGAINYPGSSQ